MYKLNIKAVIKTLLLLVVAVLLLPHRAIAQKPNILWIITDDQRADALSCYNQAVFGTNESPLGYVESPNLDKLAKEGTLFTRAYCNAPACAPSRASMQSGLYPFHNGIYGFERAHTEPDFVTPTVAQEMSKQGYKTAIFGKFGFRMNKWGPGLTWNSSEFYDHELNNKNDLARHGYTDFYKSNTYGKVNGKGVVTKRAEKFYYPDGSKKSIVMEKIDAELTEEEIKERKDIEREQEILRAYTRSQTDMILGGQSSQPSEQTLDGYVVQEFKSYLANAGKNFETLSGRDVEGPNKEEPVFINLGFHFPHSPVLVPKKYRDRFKDKTYKVPDFSKEELKKLPPQLKKIYENMKVDEMLPEDKQQAIRDYYAFCAHGDALIGDAIEAFKKYCKDNGQEYLILFVAGDHGWHLGEQGIEAKFAPWDHSTHDAVIAVSSDKTKFPEKQVHTGLVEFVDFMPTIMAAGGANLKKDEYKHLDGYDLAKVLTNKKLERKYIVGEMNHVCGPRAYMRTDNFAFSMRTRPNNAKPKANNLNKNVKWALTVEVKEAELALYDLRIDPLEQNNVANDKEYLKLAEWFRKKLGNIALGDGRVECDWSKESSFNISSFALGADDKKADIPQNIIPEVNKTVVFKQNKY